MVFLWKFSFLTFLYCSIPLVYSPACRTQYPHRLQCQSHFDHCFSLNSPGHRKWAKLHGNPLFGEQPQDNKVESQTEVRERRRKSKHKVVHHELLLMLQKTQLVSAVTGAIGSWNRSLERRGRCKSWVYQGFGLICLLAPFHWSLSSRVLTPPSSSSVLPWSPRQLPRRLHSLSHHVRLPLSLEVVGGAGGSHPGGLHADAHPAALGAAVEVDSVPNAKPHSVPNVKQASEGLILIVGAPKTFSISAIIPFLSLFLFRPTRSILISFCYLSLLCIFCPSYPLRMWRKFPGFFDFQKWLFWDIYFHSLFLFLKK